MRTRLFTIVLFLSIITVACDKEKEEPSPTTEPVGETNHACYVTEYTRTNRYRNNLNTAWVEEKENVKITYGKDHRIEQLDEISYISNTQGKVKFVYDANGRNIKTERFRNGQLEWKYEVEYNSSNQQVKTTGYNVKNGKTEPGGVTVFEYDAAGNMTASRGYNPSGENMVEYLFEYNDSNQVAAWEIHYAHAPGYKLRYEYEYKDGKAMRMTGGDSDEEMRLVYEYGEENGAFSATAKKDSIAVFHPVRNHLYQAEIPTLLITKIDVWHKDANDYENNELTGAFTYEFNEHKYPVKSVIANHSGGEETTTYVYECE